MILALGVLWLLRRRGARRTDELITELEAAFAASGQPLDPGLTLTTLAGRLGSGPAGDYVRALADARYAPAGAVVDAEPGRRALRRRLSDGRPTRVRLRVLAALPPRRERPETPL